MTSKVLLRSAVLFLVLVLLFAAFATTAVTRKDALVRGPDIETPLIGKHRQSYNFHRVKRDFWGWSPADGASEWISIETKQSPPDYCGIGEFACDDFKCISEKQRCDSVSNCDDGSDELNCPQLQQPVVWLCNPETEFSCQIESQCIPLNARCDDIYDCSDQSDEADCTWPKTTTTTEIPEATPDRVESLLEAVGKKLAGIDELNKLVRQLTGAMKNLTATNENLKREVAELRKPDAELGKRLTDQDQRITQLEAKLPEVTQSVVPKKKFTDLECRMFAMDLIIARERYAP